MKKKLMAVLLALSMAMPMNQLPVFAAEAALQKNQDYHKNTSETGTTANEEYNDQSQSSSLESEVPLTEMPETDITSDMAETDMTETKKVVWEMTEKITDTLTETEKETPVGLVSSPKQPRTKALETESVSTGNVNKAKQKKQKEYAPKSNSARITSCKGTGVDRITIKAKIAKRIKSTDSYYYLVTVDPGSGKILKRAAKSTKKTSVTFTLNTAEPNKGYVLAKYAIAVKQKKGYKVISSAKYVTNPETTANNKHTYETGQTKKGIQFTTTQDVEKVDAKNTFLNLYASTILSNPDTTYKYNGKTYHFNSLRGYEVAVSEFNAKGINVTLQLGLDLG